MGTELRADPQPPAVGKRDLDTVPRLDKRRDASLIGCPVGDEIALDDRVDRVGLALEPPACVLAHQLAADDRERDAEHQHAGERDEHRGAQQTRSQRLVLREPVTHAADGLDQLRVGRIIVQLAAQPRYVHVERLGRSEPVGIPHLGHDAVAWHDHSGLRDE